MRALVMHQGREFSFDQKPGATGYIIVIVYLSMYDIYTGKIHDT